MRASKLCLAALLAYFMLAGAAQAVIHPSQILDGPANNILEVDGTAMAPDGSGGILYRKQVGGRTHLFAIQFENGHWGGITQVDTGDPYGATQPAIAAGSGGRLLVVWVQPRNVNSHNITEYELVGASLQPGATSFGPAIVIDSNVGEPFTGDVSAVAPALAMAPNGTAYVVYRVVTDDCALDDEKNPELTECPPGNSTDKLLDVRVARFHYLSWSSLGAINRASQLPMRNPTSANAPAIGIDVNGNGLVAWQEPGSDGVARIWVRRLFGVVLGNVLQASPETQGSRAIGADADAPTVALGLYGEARIGYRLQGAAGVPSQLYLNSISSELGLKASQLNGAGAVAGTAGGDLGAPSAAIDSKGEYRLAWTQGGAASQLGGTTESIGAPVSIGAAAGPAYTTINPVGGGTTAWSAQAGGLPVVEVREDYARGAFELASLAGSVAGPVGELSLAGSGAGDALLGWTQGPVGDSEVVGDLVQAPPAAFNLSVPSGWVSGRSAKVTWEASTDAVTGVGYTVYVDGKPRSPRLTGLAAQLSPVALGDGVHRLQILAVDASGQQTMSSQHTLRVDANPPVVTAQLIDHRHGVRVRVRDRASGVSVRSTRISFGDGQRQTKRTLVSHEYRRAGTYRITAQVRDKVGNHATVTLRVRVQ